jgi:hypothetical protein
VPGGGLNMAAQICETCKNKGKRCYCSPNSTCGGYEPRKVTWFEELKNMDIDELVDWICKYVSLDDSPCLTWWDKQYCQNCLPVTVSRKDYRDRFGCSGYGDTVECAYCEWEGKCKYFQKLESIPSIKDIVKMWLESEVEE